MSFLLSAELKEPLSFSVLWVGKPCVLSVYNDQGWASNTFLLSRTQAETLKKTEYTGIHSPFIQIREIMHFISDEKPWTRFLLG